MVSLVSLSRHSIKRLFRADASPKMLASMFGYSRQLVPPASTAPYIHASRACAPTSAFAKLSATRSIVCCSGSSSFPLVLAVRNVKAAELLDTVEALKLLDTCGSDIIKLGVPYSHPLADDPVIQAEATRFLARGCNFDAIKSMLEVVPQLSFPVAFLKLGFEKFMSILEDAGFRGQRPPTDNDVFISYKQEDTLHYVSYLKNALDRRGVKTFVDSTLEGGVEVQPAIEEAIERSKIAVVIVSQNYHLSPWCLIELEKILECQRKWGLIVLPILRGMNPKDLREQPRHFVENIGQGEKGLQEQPYQFQKYRDALRALGRIKALPVLCSSDIPEAHVTEDTADYIKAMVSRLV